MSRKSILLVIMCLISLAVEAQQIAQFTQYYINPYIINPAASGLTKTISVDLGFRKQWMGIQDSPQTIYGTIHSQIGFDKRDKTLDDFNPNKDFIYSSPLNSVGVNKHVVGASIYNDQIGPFRETNVMASYAVHIRFALETMLSFGVSAGYSNFGIYSSKILLLQQDDSRYEDFLTKNANQSLFDLNAGIVFYAKRFQLGISSMHLVGNKIKLADISSLSKYGRHWFIYGMYTIPFQSSKISLEPHFMFQMMKHAPLSMNLGARIHIDRKYWVNLGYRLQDAISIGAGLNFGNFVRLGYSYDIAIGKVQRVSNMVHEITLGFTFGSKRVVQLDSPIDENNQLDE